MKINRKQWKRMNPIEHKKIRFMIMHKLFDGDHAPQNNYAVRKDWTIERVIDAVNEMEEITKHEQQQAIALEDFKVMALDGKITINLKDVDDYFFYDSVHLDEFWRVAFKIYEIQRSDKNV